MHSITDLNNLQQDIAYCTIYFPFVNGGFMFETVEEKYYNRQEMLHQLSLERQQMLEEAIQRAERCEATPEDFDLIREELALYRGN
jgi:hypothetical protein